MDHITSKNRCLGFAALNCLEKQTGEHFPSTEVRKWYTRAGVEPGSSSKEPLNTEFYLEAMKIVPLAGHTLKSCTPVWHQDGNKYKPGIFQLFKLLGKGCFIFEMHTDGHEFVPRSFAKGAHAVALHERRSYPYVALDTAWKEGIILQKISDLSKIRTIWEVKFN